MRPMSHVNQNFACKASISTGSCNLTGYAFQTQTHVGYVSVQIHAMLCEEVHQ